MWHGAMSFSVQHSRVRNRCQVTELKTECPDVRGSCNDLRMVEGFPWAIHFSYHHAAV